MTITTYLQQHKVRLGVLELKGRSIVKYIEKPTKEYLVSIGMYVLNKHIVDIYVEEKAYLDFPTLINILIQNKIKINSYLHDGLWIDIGTTEEYLNLIENLEGIIKNNPTVPISS